VGVGVWLRFDVHGSSSRVRNISWARAVNLEIMRVDVGELVHKLLMVYGLSVVHSSNLLMFFNYPSSTNLRGDSTLHALPLNHLESLVFSHRFHCASRRDSRTHCRTPRVWAHIWGSLVWAMNWWRIHRVRKHIRWTLRHASYLILSLVENWEHVCVRDSHLDYIFIPNRLVLHLLRWTAVLLVLDLEVVELELLFLLVETHLLPWGLPVGLVLRLHLVGRGNLVWAVLLGVVVVGYDSSLGLVWIVGTKGRRPLFFSFVHLLKG